MSEQDLLFCWECVAYDYRGRVICSGEGGDLVDAKLAMVRDLPAKRVKQIARVRCERVLVSIRPGRGVSGSPQNTPTI